MGSPLQEPKNRAPRLFSCSKTPRTSEAIFFRDFGGSATARGSLNSGRPAPPPGSDLVLNFGADFPGADLVLTLGPIAPEQT